MADNNIWVACQVTDDIDYVLKYAGETQLVVGTDYGPNDTSTEIEAIRKLSSDGKVSPEVAQKILDGDQVGIGIEQLGGHRMTQLMAGYRQTGFLRIILHAFLDSPDR